MNYMLFYYFTFSKYNNMHINYQLSTCTIISKSNNIDIDYGNMNEGKWPSLLKYPIKI